MNTEYVTEIFRFEDDGVYTICFFFHANEKDTTWYFNSKEERDDAFKKLQKELNISIF